MAAAATQGEEVAEQDAAVAAENHRKAARVQGAADRVGEPDGVLGDADRVEDTRGGVPPQVVRRGFDAAGPYRPGVIEQTGIDQGRGQVLDTGRAQPEHGRRFDDRRLSHHPVPSPSAVSYVHGAQATVKVTR